MSALLLSLGISGGVVLAAVPLIGQVASASVVARDPDAGDVVPPCDAGESCEPTEVVTTVTITTTLPTPTPTQTDPVTTVTTTVTPSATKISKAPEPQKTTQAPTSPPVTQEQPVQPPPVVPTSGSVAPPTTAEPEPTFSFPSVQESAPTTLDTGTPTTAPTDSEQLVVRNAAPEYNQADLSRKLGIPALVLVLLALFAVLIFEGRLRRLAHAAAVRRAGPQGPGRHRGEPTPEPYGYPAGPGYAGAVPAYAPIISFVPVQTYPGGPAQYAPVYQQPYPQDPAMYGQQVPTAEYPGYAQHPGHPQPGHPQPGYTQPEYAQPGFPQPEHAQPEHAQPEYGQPDYQQTEHQQGDYGQGDYRQPEDVQHEEPRFDAFQPREFQVAGDDPLPADLVTGSAGYRGGSMADDADASGYLDESAGHHGYGERASTGDAGLPAMGDAEAPAGPAGHLRGRSEGGEGFPGVGDWSAEGPAGSAGHLAEGRSGAAEGPEPEYRDLFEPLVPPDQQPLGDLPPGGDAPYGEPHHSHPVPSAPTGLEPGDAEPWQFGDDRQDDPSSIVPMTEDRDRREF
ncbi:hypothetical protein [Nonomuraea africana]|uniref:hypothetical protein n=1 Tax=Nonomuraea africana TaxID=46171 RepID=UPI00178A6776|nr:hypothetical protein [Nonomuraea africana]